MMCEEQKCVFKVRATLTPNEPALELEVVKSSLVYLVDSILLITCTVVSFKNVLLPMRMLQLACV